MRRFYLFLGLCALTANTSFAVQTVDSSTRLGNVRTNKITSNTAETKKHFFPLKNANTPVLSAITSQKSTTLGSFNKNTNSVNDARLTVTNKIGPNKNNINSYQYNIPNTSIPSPQNQPVSSQQVTTLQNKIDELQAQLEIMQKALEAKANIDEVTYQNNIIDNKIAQIETKTDSLTNETISNTVRDVLTSENVITQSDLNQSMNNVEIAINIAKNAAIETAAVNANARYVKSADFTDQVNNVLDSHGEFLTADSTNLLNKVNAIIAENNAENNFVKSADFANELAKNNVLNTTDKNELVASINTAKVDAIAAADESASNKFVQNGNDLRTKVGALLTENEVLKKADRTVLENKIYEAKNDAIEAAAADAASKYLTTSSTGLSERIADAVTEMGFVKNTDFADKLYENGVLNSTDKAELIAAIDALQNAQDDALTPEDVDEIITGNGFIKGNDQIITDIYGRINQNKEDITRNKENIDDTTQDINGLTGRLASAETQIDKNKTNIGKNTDNFNNYTQTGDLDSVIATAFKDGSQLKNKVNTLVIDKGYITNAALNGYVQENDLTDYLKSDSTVITSLTGRLSAAESQITQNTNSITSNSNRLNSAETTIASNTSKITDTENDVDNLTSRVSQNEANTSENANKITQHTSAISAAQNAIAANTANFANYPNTAALKEAFGGNANDNKTLTENINDQFGQFTKTSNLAGTIAGYVSTGATDLQTALQTITPNALASYPTTSELKNAFGFPNASSLTNAVSNGFGAYTVAIANSINTGSSDIATALSNKYPNKTQLASAFGATSGDNFVAASTALRGNLSDVQTSANSAKDGISAIADVLTNTSNSPFANNNVLTGVAAHFPYNAQNNTMLQAVAILDDNPPPTGGNP